MSYSIHHYHYFVISLTLVVQTKDTPIWADESIRIFSFGEKLET